MLDINSTFANLGPKCLQLLGMHAISGCDTTSYPFSKGKATALKILLAGDYHGLANVLGEVGATTERVSDRGSRILLHCIDIQHGSIPPFHLYLAFQLSPKHPVYE